MRFRPANLTSTAAAAVLAFACPALANSFAPNGSFLFEPTAVTTEGFENFPIALGGEYETPEVADALEGNRILSLDTGRRPFELRLDLPPTAAVAYELSLWVRGEGLSAIAVEYDDNAAGDLGILFPTGRMTSDGWVEMRSAPFSVDGPRGSAASLVFLGAFEVDAVEVHKSTTPFMGPERCAGLTDPSCAGDRICLSGWCRNTAGWVPPLPDDQVALSAYLENRLRFFFGPYLNRERYLPAALAETAAMAHAPSRWRFWNGFATAVRRLRDSHTSASSMAHFFIDSTRQLNSCFTLGDADLTQGLAPSDPNWPDVVVSHVGTSHHWNLNAGDRLVAVDGVHPIVWMQSLIAHDMGFSAANDPSSLAMHAENLRSSIPLYASKITVIRCHGTDCGPPEDIDVMGIPELAPDEEVDVVSCDHRPQPLVEGQPTDHRMSWGANAGPVLEADSDEKIYGLVWDSLITGSPAESTINAAVAEWRSDARGVVLDHRVGNGGSGPSGGTSIADPILAFVMPETLFGVMPFRRSADDEGPKTKAEGLDLVAQFQGTSSAWRGGGPDPRTDVPVALLITRDVSFSDLFPYAFRGAQRVRVFGPHPTNGAFSSFYGMNYWLGMGLQLAAGDTIGADGTSLCGRGAQPHEVVLPRQSDLVAGVDTSVVRALSWIRKELAP